MIVYVVRAGTEWLLVREWQDADGCVCRVLLASSPDPRAIEAAMRLFRGAA